MTTEALITLLERRLMLHLSRGFRRVLDRPVASSATIAPTDDHPGLEALFEAKTTELADRVTSATQASVSRTLASVRRTIRWLLIVVSVLLLVVLGQWFWFRHELAQRTPTQQQITWMLRGYQEHQKEASP